MLNIYLSIKECVKIILFYFKTKIKCHIAFEKLNVIFSILFYRKCLRYSKYVWICLLIYLVFVK